MRVLIGCEESGTVRDAFRRAGHEAWSNDLVEGRGYYKKAHLQMDVMDAIQNKGPWDIIILHPDCTALALSGNRWYGEGMPHHQKRLDSIEWTKKLWLMAKIYAKVGCALENPTSVIWKHLREYQKAQQELNYIQPWQFGHGETKKTGLLTYNLPPLQPTNIVEGREPKVWKMPPSPTRKRDRSKTYQGIADAMAQQWGDLK
jgi:hypothetical protein